MKALIARGLGALIGFGASKLSAATGIVVDPATQASVAIAAYALTHKVIERLLGVKRTQDLGL